MDDDIDKRLIHFDGSASALTRSASADPSDTVQTNNETPGRKSAGLGVYEQYDVSNALLRPKPEDREGYVAPHGPEKDATVDHTTGRDDDSLNSQYGASPLKSARYDEVKRHTEFEKKHPGERPGEAGTGSTSNLDILPDDRKVIDP